MSKKSKHKQENTSRYDWFVKDFCGRLAHYLRVELGKNKKKQHKRDAKENESRNKLLGEKKVKFTNAALANNVGISEDTIAAHPIFPVGKASPAPSLHGT